MFAPWDSNRPGIPPGPCTCIAAKTSASAGPDGVAGIKLAVTASESSVISTTAFAADSTGDDIIANFTVTPSIARNVSHGAPPQVIRKSSANCGDSVGHAGNSAVSIVTNRFAAVTGNARAPSARNVTAPATTPRVLSDKSGICTIATAANVSRTPLAATKTSGESTPPKSDAPGSPARNGYSASKSANGAVGANWIVIGVKQVAVASKIPCASESTASSSKAGVIKIPSCAKNVRPPNVADAGPLNNVVRVTGHKIILGRDGSPLPSLINGTRRDSRPYR